VTLVIVLRLIMMVIVDGTHTHTYTNIYIYRHKHETRKNYCNILVLKWMGKKKGLMSRKRKHTNSRITVLVVDRDTERLSRMYKILLCYAQTHKYIIYIERDCVRDKALLYKKKLFDEGGNTN
jgi:hypothetical protein